MNDIKQRSDVIATSNPMQISFVLDAILQINPNSMLDIGCGSGKYGVLAREYLRQARIHAIEGFDAYINDIHRSVYDNIVIGDALMVIPELRESYDLVIMIDMFEHVTPAQGAKLLQDLQSCTSNVLISVPVYHPVQGAVDGNLLQEHRAQYDVRMLKKLGFDRIWRISGSYIALRGPARVNVKVRALKVAATCVLPHWISNCLAPVSRMYMKRQV